MWQGPEQYQTLMPYAPSAKRVKRSYTTKRRQFKKASPSSLILRPIVPAQDNTFSTTRRFRLALGFIPSILVADNGGYQSSYGLSVSLGDLPNWQEYTSLFDQFRITGAEIEFHPRYNSNISATGDNHLCILGHFQDSNNVDLTGLSAAENGWLERAGYRQSLLDKVTKVKWTPRPQSMVYRTSTTTGYQVKSPTAMNDWIAATDYNCPHYGLYFRIYAPDASAALTDDMVHVYVNLSFQCKSTR